MSFAQALEKFKSKTVQNMGLIRSGVDSHVFTSIVDGSSVTGAPGQPIKTRKLHDSWKQEVEGTETVTSTDVPYARAVEENWGDVTYENGGPYSVSLTVAGFPHIVETVAREVSQ